MSILVTVELSIDQVAAELFNTVRNMKDPTPDQLAPPFNYALTLLITITERMLEAHNDAKTATNMGQVLHAAINEALTRYAEPAKETLQ